MATNTRAQRPAIQVTGNISRTFGNIAAHLTSPTPTLQKRIGAMQTPIQAHNSVKREPAGHGITPLPLNNPSTSRAAIVASRDSARGITEANHASRMGSGSSPAKPKSIAGMPDTYNVGGQGGHSSVLAVIPAKGNPAAHTKKIVSWRQSGATSPTRDVTRTHLTPLPQVPVHMGFNHVGFRTAK